MSRSNYEYDCDGWALIRWRGAVASATKGARGQQMLRELATALDAMPVKRLIAESLEVGGEVCALGCLGRTKGIEMSRLDPEEPEQVAKAFGIAPALAQEIVWVNDEWARHQTPEERWAKMRQWVGEQIKHRWRVFDVYAGWMTPDNYCARNKHHTRSDGRWTTWARPVRSNDKVSDGSEPFAAPRG